MHMMLGATPLMRRKAVKGEVLGRPPYGYKVGSRRRLLNYLRKTDSNKYLKLIEDLALRK